MQTIALKANSLNVDSLNALTEMMTKTYKLHEIYISEFFCNNLQFIFQK